MSSKPKISKKTNWKVVLLIVAVVLLASALFIGGVFDDDDDDDVCAGIVDGTPCDDGNDATTGTVCTANVCGPPPATPCPVALSDCKTAGIRQDDGTCSGETDKTDGTACNDGTCKVAGTCAAGVCSSSANVVDGTACNAVTGLCIEAGTCAAGVCSSSANFVDGTGCDDGDGTTSNDVCTAGICAGVAASAGVAAGAGGGPPCSQGQYDDDRDPSTPCIDEPPTISCVTPTQQNGYINLESINVATAISSEADIALWRDFLTGPPVDIDAWRSANGGISSPWSGVNCETGYTLSQPIYGVCCTDDLCGVVNNVADGDPYTLRGCTANCTVSGLSAPTDGALDAACSDQETLQSGSSCLLTCNAGYTLSGVQPSCAEGVFDIGNISCADNLATTSGAAGAQDCVWSPCTANCETAAERSLVSGAADCVPRTAGATAPQGGDCTPGEGDCQECDMSVACIWKYPGQNDQSVQLCEAVTALEDDSACTAVNRTDGVTGPACSYARTDVTTTAAHGIIGGTSNVVWQSVAERCASSRYIKEGTSDIGQRCIETADCVPADNPSRTQDVYGTVIGNITCQPERLENPVSPYDRLPPAPGAELVCQPNPVRTCTGFDCTLHENNLDGDPGNITCPDGPCTPTECCTDLQNYSSTQDAFCNAPAGHNIPSTADFQVGTQIQAKALCDVNPECMGFTMRGDPSDQAAMMYLLKKWPPCAPDKAAAAREAAASSRQYGHRGTGACPDDLVKAREPGSTPRYSCSLKI